MDESMLTEGDVAILRFLAAAELIESDLWQQYNELGGAAGGNPAYMAALRNLDADMPQYITDNTDDELSHAAFLNAYLKGKGAEPVNLDAFRTLPSSTATGAKQIGRLTNLLRLNVDTSWFTRYRSEENPDFGATFPQAVSIRDQPAIPLNDVDTPPTTPQPVPPVTPQARRMQAIANTAGFHFGFIEVGGSSLYTSLSLKATSLEVLRIVVSIGGVEVDHFSLWHDKAGNCCCVAASGRCHGPRNRSHISGSQCPAFWRRGLPDQPGLARALRLHSRGGSAALFGHPSFPHEECGCGRGDQGTHGRPAVRGSVGGVL